MSDRQLILRWETDELSDSRIAYGLKDGPLEMAWHWAWLLPQRRSRPAHR